MLAGTGEHDRNPMFYGLPAVMKIYQSTDGGDSSPLTIREGRLWVNKTVGDAYREGIPEQTDQNLYGNTVEAGKERTAQDSSNSQGRTNGPAITVRDLWFRYDKKSQDVLRDLNLTVDRDQLFCVLGGYVILHQNLSVREIIGSVLMFLAIMIVQAFPSKEKSKSGN